MVDVRDVAMAHVLALEIEEAGGERFVVSNGPFTYAELREFFYPSTTHYQQLSSSANSSFSLPSHDR